MTETITVNSTGEAFLQNGLYPNPGTFSSYSVHAAFDTAFNHAYATLVAQGAGAQLFTGDTTYNPGTDSFDGITDLDSGMLDDLAYKCMPSKMIMPASYAAQI